jgi:hypothetical protein
MVTGWMSVNFYGYGSVVRERVEVGRDSERCGGW